MSWTRLVLSGFGAAHFPERKSIGKPDNLPAEDDVPPAFASRFDKCLQFDARKRFDDVVEAAEAFGELARKTAKLSLEKQLERYRHELDPISDYAPLEWITQKACRIYRARKNDADLFVKSWPERSLGERRKAATGLPNWLREPMARKYALPKVVAISPAEIVAVRERTGISQTVLAAFMNVAVITVSQREPRALRGGVKMCSHSGDRGRTKRSARCAGGSVGND